MSLPHPAGPRAGLRGQLGGQGMLLLHKSGIPFPSAGAEPGAQGKPCPVQRKGCGIPVSPYFAQPWDRAAPAPPLHPGRDLSHFALCWRRGRNIARPAFQSLGGVHSPGCYVVGEVGKGQCSLGCQKTAETHHMPRIQIKTRWTPATKSSTLPINIFVADWPFLLCANYFACTAHLHLSHS